MSDKAPSSPGSTPGAGEVTPSPLSGTRTSGASPQLTQTPSLEVGAQQTSYSVYLDEDSSSDSGAWYSGEPAEDVEDRLVGTVLSNTYQVVRILGEGGMGRVYEARHTRIASKRFAVKALHPEFARRKDVLARFPGVVSAATRITPPWLVGLYDVAETADGRPYFVSELLEGEELGDYLDKVGMMSIAPAVRIVRQICQALHAAHEVGVVHRDIKPENVFLCGDVVSPDIKVLDFGISRLEGRGGNTLTKTGMVMGTPSYMSPEQARGERVDHRTDIYAAGAILYRTVTGKIPFDKEDATATLAAVLMEEPEPPRAVAPHIPETLELIIQRAMARNPDERYPSIADLDAALAPFDEESDESPRTRQASMSGRRPRLASQTTVVGLEHERAVQSARPQLLLLSAVVALGVVLAIMGLATGIIRLTRGGETPTLTGTEALVIALVVLVGLATPMVLLTQHIKKNLWRNTAKVVELVQLLRDPVLVGLGTSGFVAVVVRVLETTVLRRPAAMAWAAWDLLVPLSGAAVGLGAFLWKRQGVRASGTMALALFGVALTASSIMLSLSHDAASGSSPPLTGTEPAEDGDAAPLSDATGSALPATTAASSSRPGRSQASYKAWEELYQRVRRRQLGPALDAAEKLMKLDPTAPEEKEVRSTILELAVQAFYQRNEHSERIAELMSTKMGPWGPDLLFEIMVTRGATEADRQAQRLLGDPQVLARGSEGMRLAYAIRTAKGCDDKKARILLAKKAGDYRVVREINILQRCHRRQKCCLNDDDDVDAVKAAIEARR